jgi:hypothetical protein
MSSSLPLHSMAPRETTLLVAVCVPPAVLVCETVAETNAEVVSGEQTTVALTFMIRPDAERVAVFSMLTAVLSACAVTVVAVMSPALDATATSPVASDFLSMVFLLGGGVTGFPSRVRLLPFLTFMTSRSGYRAHG